MIKSLIVSCNNHKGRKVIGLGHSLGSVLTLMASYRRPELFSQVIMLDPPLIIGKASFVFHLAKIFKPNWSIKSRLQVYQYVERSLGVS